MHLTNRFLIIASTILCLSSCTSDYQEDYQKKGIIPPNEIRSESIIVKHVNFRIYKSGEAIGTAYYSLQFEYNAIGRDTVWFLRNINHNCASNGEIQLLNAPEKLTYFKNKDSYEFDITLEAQFTPDKTVTTTPFEDNQIFDSSSALSQNAFQKSPKKKMEFTGSGRKFDGHKHVTFFKKLHFRQYANQLYCEQEELKCSITDQINISDYTFLEKNDIPEKMTYQSAINTQ